MHRVEHRVSIKKSLAARLEQELVQAQLAAGRAPKRQTGSSQNQPRKLQRLEAPPQGSERNLVQLMAQKQRLQQLEAEYAQKIQKLKEAQAQRNRGVLTEPRASTPTDPPPPLPQPPSSFPLPQPSLHDLTQDKLTLDSEDVPEADDPEPEPEPATASRGGRRSSLRQSSCSFTKPNLDALGSAPPKDGAAKPTKTPSSSEAPAEMIGGLDVDALRRGYQQQGGLGDLLLKELQALGEDVDEAPAGQVSGIDTDMDGDSPLWTSSPSCPNASSSGSSRRVGDDNEPIRSL